MIRFLYFCYNINATSTSFIGRFIAKIARKVTSILSILILPIYFYFIRLYVLPRLNKTSEGTIVTLTSFPARITNIYQVIMSLMIQNTKAQEIILYLSKEQFQSFDDLPKSLTQLLPYGLKIIFVDADMRSYKKYIYNKKYFGDVGFIIVDDDIIYHPDTISILLETEREFPKSVCANRCITMQKDKSYQDWELANKKGTGPYMATGCAGVYYPSNTLNEIAYDKKSAWINCPDGDDIWLKASAKIANSNVVFTGFNQLLLPVLNDNANDLHVQNVTGKRNDINLKNTEELLFKEYNKSFYN